MRIRSASVSLLFAATLLGVSSSPASADPNAERPNTPTRHSVVEAMNALSPAVRSCGQGQHGTAPVRIEFEGATGRVTQASVRGGSFPPEVVACIEREVRSAVVPPFRQPRFSVNFPFRL